ncbi:MAG: VCBS repeat-containing protein [Chitinophagales bacterium]|nr:VCBS repeat-containing protein [Chitinophagales bacterium]MDW8426937.1 VCBS repeat-containing protein [Chitinophagales bacterium]
MQVLLKALCLAALLPAIPLFSQNPEFQLLPAEYTGISFTNELVETQQLNVLAYEYFYNGGGVAAGDINNDGLCDLYFVSNLKANRLYLNLGNFKFQDITIQSGTASRPGWKTGACMADVNADGWLDIYVCHSGRLPGPQRANELFINNGNLTFSERAAEFGLADTGYATHATFFDFDGDSDLDCYLLNHNIVTLRHFEVARMRLTPDPKAGDRLLRNDGGRFTDVTQQANIYSSAIGFGLGVAVSDLDGDQRPDLYIANDYTEHDYLYLNMGNGTFREVLKERVGHCPQFAMGNDIADINNDGWPDIVVLDMLPEDHYRQKVLRGPNNYDKYHLQVKHGFHHQVMRNCLLLNLGNAYFSEIGQLAGIAATDWSWAPLLADFDLDGWKDLYITNGYRRDYTNMDFLKFAYEEEKSRALREGREPDLLALVHQMPSVKVANYMYRNTGTLRFENVTKEWNLYHPAFSNGAAYADLDNDGDWDLVVNNIDEPAFVYRNLCRERLQRNYLAIRLMGPPSNPFGIGTRLYLHTDQGVQMQELFSSRGYQSSVQERVLFGLHDRTNVLRLVVLWPDGRRHILEKVPINTAIHVDWKQGRSFPDKPPIPPKPLLEPLPAHVLPFIHKENDYVDFKREPLLPHKFSRQGPALAVADVNGDRLDDVFLGGAAGQPGQLFLQRRNGTFVAKPIADFDADRASEDVAALFFDADLDGDYDLYVCSGGYEFEPNDSLLQDRLYLNDGTGSFTRRRSALPRMCTSTACVTSTDYDNDGDADLFVGGRVVPGHYGISPRSYLLENNQGIFTDATARTAPGLMHAGMVSDALWTDLNRDQWPDLVLCGEWTPIRVFLNRQGVLSEHSHTAGLSFTHGWWNALLAADLNGDGHMDLIGGNRGENHLIKASKEKPATLFVADFDTNGATDPILCYYFGDTSYPLPSRDELLDQINILRKKYVYYHEYANQRLEDIFSPQQIAEATRLPAYTFQSTAFFNDGSARFISIPLPPEAQFSRAQGLIFYDLTGDSRGELVVVGNHHYPRAEMGRDDASFGAVFEIIDTSFRFVPLHKSGLMAFGDVRRAAIVHARKEPLLLAVRNDAPPLLWRIKKGVRKHHIVAISD